MSKLTKIPLTGVDMMVLNPDTKLLKYTDLYQYNTVEELFENYEKVIILYLIFNESSGHWVCLFKNKVGLCFFDSYGVPLDYELEAIPKAKRIQLHEQQSYLKKLLFHDEVCYNNITYQEPNTATCGCHVSYRLNNSHLNDVEYFKLIASKKIKPDILVSSWCFNKLENL